MGVGFISNYFTIKICDMIMIAPPHTLFVHHPRDDLPMWCTTHFRLLSFIGECCGAKNKKHFHAILKNRDACALSLRRLPLSSDLLQLVTIQSIEDLDLVR